jgi:hypothetical protein
MWNMRREIDTCEAHALILCALLVPPLLLLLL